MRTTELKRQLRAALEAERKKADLYGYFADQATAKQYVDAQRETDRLVDLVDLDVQNTD
jgi:hypothetical protein